MRTHRPPGLAVVDHEFDLPLDHADPGGEQIRVYAREVAEPEGRGKPFLLFLQGGPGFEAPRPTGAPPSPAWLERALEDFRVLMLDQRGTGRSTPVGALEDRTPAQQAAYLTHFRADAIVRDAERIREALGVPRWSVLGQSFGGMCVMTYLSVAPDALREALITGGVPALHRHVDEVYTATWAQLRERAQAYYARYPGDRERVREVARRLEAEELRLPGGERLTARRFRTLGGHLGTGDGAEQLHYRLELPIESPAFRHAWPALYDVPRLRGNEVAIAAAVYVDDPYVPRAFSEETAAIVPGLRAWVTNEYLHNGLRADGGRILGRLLDMAGGRA